MKQPLPSFLPAINLKSFLFLTLAWSSLSLVSNAQNTKNNHTGNWENTNTWIGGVIPSAVDGSWFISTVEGFVMRNGDMSLANDATISLSDTLVVMGNLTLSGSGKINVSSNGLLVVVGDYTSFNTGAATIDNDNSTTGRVVVTGNYTQTQGQVTTGDAFYIYDTTPSFDWGASVNGTNFNNNPITLSVPFENESELASNDPPLYAFVNGLIGLLPVDVQSFAALSAGEIIKLSWVTASERDFDKFIVERSITGTDFEKIGEMESARNSKTMQKYSFNDSRPFSGKNYYRLKLLDFDGSVNHSAVAVADIDLGKRLMAYPNPGDGAFVNIATNFSPGENDEIQVFDDAGSLVASAKFHGVLGKLFFSSALKPGSYVLKYTSPDFNQATRMVVR